MLFSPLSGFVAQSHEALLAHRGHHGQWQWGPRGGREAAGGDQGECGATCWEQAQPHRGQRQGGAPGEGQADAQ